MKAVKQVVHHTVDFEGVTYYAADSGNCTGCAFFDARTGSNSVLDGCKIVRTKTNCYPITEPSEHVHKQANWMTLEDWTAWRLTK